MNRKILVQRLAHAKQLVKVGERHLRRQREIVEQRQRDGQSGCAAQDLLRTYEITQSYHLAERDRIEHELAIATSHVGPEYWLVRAEQARARAAQLSEPRCRQIMHGMAEGYREMAEAAKRLDKSYAVLSKSKSA